MESLKDAKKAASKVDLKAEMMGRMTAVNLVVRWGELMVAHWVAQ